MYKSFVKKVKIANLKIKYHIDNNLSKDDYKLTNTTGFGGDKSLNIDIIFENIFIKYLLQFGDIFSEECGLVKSKANNGYKIIIDPLDGSDNFYSHIPYYGTSVALVLNGKTKVGVICNLATLDFVIKIKGKKTKYSHKISNNNPKLAIFERAYKYPKLLKQLQLQNYKIRTNGAIALSLTSARDVQFVLFGGSPRIFDIEAGLFINNKYYVYKSDKFLLISRYKKIFKQIKKLCL